MFLTVIIYAVLELLSIDGVCVRMESCSNVASNFMMAMI